MNRRELTVAAGTGVVSALAGCAGVLDGGPKYEPGNEDTLLPDSPGTDWPDILERNDELNDSFDQVWSNVDETILVMMSADIYEEIDGAKDMMGRSEATAKDADDYPLADDGIVYDDEGAARCVFRDSNAVAQVLAARQSGLQWVADRQRATNYAELLYQSWQ